MSETYVNRLRVLQDIRRMTGGKFELSLPQICVVGDQSSGKSSVLTQITDIPFPTKSGICTKAAIVVECVRAAAGRFEVRDGDGDAYSEVRRENLAARILALQERALEKTGAKVSREEIHVRVSGPEQVDLVVIDLPGIIHQGAGKAEVAALIEEYVKSPQTLIMLVSEAKQDTELVTAIGTAHKHDPAGHRTVRVLTKFDNFDSEDAKERACEWVTGGVDLGTTDVDSSTQGRSGDIQLSLSPHSVICAPGGKEYSAYEEEHELRDNLGLPPQRSGVKSLKERLPPIYSVLIGNNVIKVIEQVDAKLKLAQASLTKIGKAPIGADAMILECHRALVEMVPAFEEALSEPLWHFEKAVRETKEKITPEWTSDKYVPNAFRTPCFQGNQAFELCARDICELFWTPIVEILFSEIDAVMCKALDTLDRCTAGVSPNLLKALKKEWVGNFYRSQLLQPFEEKCKAVLAKERCFGTVNHYLTHKVDTDRICPDELIEEYYNMIQEDDLSTYRSDTRRTPRPISESKEHLKKKLKIARENYLNHRRIEDLHERQRREVYDAVCSHWQVEHKTLTDCITKEVRECILDPFQVWVRSTVSPQNRALTAAAVEDAEVAAEREHLLEQIAAMRSCEEKLQTIL